MDDENHWELVPLVYPFQKLTGWINHNIRQRCISLIVHV